MDAGIRPMIPATENRHARGMAKISAYGARSPRGPPPWRPAPSALVIVFLPAQNPNRTLRYSWVVPGSAERPVPAAYARLPKHRPLTRALAVPGWMGIMPDY